MRSAILLALLLVSPLAAATGPYVYHGLLGGASFVAMSRHDYVRFPVEAGQRVETTLEWDTEDGALMLAPYVSTGPPCNILRYPMQCTTEFVAAATGRWTCIPREGDIFAERSRLTVSFDVPFSGIAYADVVGLRHTSSVPFVLTVALDGEAPQDRVIWTGGSYIPGRTGLEPSVCDLRDP